MTYQREQWQAHQTGATRVGDPAAMIAEET